MTKQGSECPNYNHLRTSAPVRFCPMCGEVVNKNVSIKKCNEGEHAIKRREGNTYCVNCGERLIQEMR